MGAIYTHLEAVPVREDSVSMRMMLNSNRTVLPLPVGAGQSVGLNIERSPRK